MAFSTHSTGQFILFNAPEVEVVVEMKRRKLGFPEDLVAEFASTLHDCSKHLVVVPPRKEYFAGEQFE